MPSPPTTEVITSPQSGPDDDWFFAGLASSFPNMTDPSEPYFKLAWPQTCKDGSKVPGCKVFHPKVSSTSSSSSSTVEEIPIDAAVGEDAWLMKEQVLVFQYKGRFHAVDHACPHRAYSLSWATPFDIEDAGRTLGYGIRCRGHSFAFELSTGIGDRGEYRLGVWDVELRSRREGGGQAEKAGGDDAEEQKGVWVRRRRGMT